ncbi:MAG: YlxR family protein [Bacillota bacterium]|nr:YlxR family protein [Bacillota bacterium]
MLRKKIPLRRCLGCNEMKPKKELIRIVKTAEELSERCIILGEEGKITLDLTGKKPGRGAYICNNINCFKAMRKAKRLDRAFNCKVPDEVYDLLEAEVANNEQ